MHHLDRTFSEIYEDRAELGGSERAHAETSPEAETATEAALSEADEMELAAELLSVTSEAELDHFLGKLIKGVGKFMHSGAGKVLGGILKTVARKALPIIGNVVAPGVGGLVGGALASALKPRPHDAADKPPHDAAEKPRNGRAPRRAHEPGDKPSAADRPEANPSEIFGLELEGLSAEDQEFEAARYFVRFAVAASKELGEIDPGTAPREAAVMAATSAAKAHAPGLLQETAPASPRPQHPLHGRWIRRGDTIVVLGV